MKKFSPDTKIQAVTRYLNGVESLNTVAKLYRIHQSIFINWVRQYEYHGEKAFNKGYTSYSTQDKLDVLNHMNEHGTSVRETAAVFNISSHSTILSWQRSLESHGIDALQSKKKGRPSMNKDSKEQKNQMLVEGSVEALKAEVDRLRMENAYLKKLNALVQNKEKSPNKTKRK